jgi:hypothetical protein
MRRWLIVILLLLPFFISRPAQAQSSTVIDRLEVDLWPEYDRPDVLVIYRVTLSPQTALPARLSLRIPKEVTKPSNLAVKDVDGLLYNIDTYTLSQEGDWQAVNFTTPSLEVQLEYYDPTIKKDSTVRTYKYTWDGDYTVKYLAFQVKQPVDSSNMQILPQMGTGLVGSDGLTNFTIVAGEKMADSQYSLQISYNKRDDRLSYTPAPVGPIDPINQQTAGRTSMMDILPWMLGVLGMFLIAGGAFWYWQAGRGPAMPERRRREPVKVAAARDRTEPAGPPKQIYCHQCGKPASGGDIFCRSCGSRLRRE